MSLGLLPPPPGEVFCDHLTCTVPPDEWHSLRPELESVLDGVYCESPQSGVYLCPLGGWVKVGKRSGVVWVQASGGLLLALRKLGLYNAYLSLFAARPHRVTRLDASLDLAVDAQPEIIRLYMLARGEEGEIQDGGIKLSQKTVKRSNVSVILNPSRLDGRNTGTLYIGGKKAEVKLVVYDKREEFYASRQLDLGHRIRYELRVTGKMGVTLRDAGSPAGVFWHFLSPGILTAPSDAPPWEPFTDGGFEVQRPEILPYVRLKNRVENSTELPRLLALADALGPEGRKIFFSMIDKYHPPGLGAGGAGAAKDGGGEEAKAFGEEGAEAPF